MNFRNVLTHSALIPILLACGACQGSPKKDATATPSPLKPPQAKALPGPLPVVTAVSGPALQPLTSVGSNSEARFSPDGSALLFISQGRPSHKNAQIYHYDIKTRLEHRVSYHAGDDRQPSYSPNGQEILYSSNTDEVKEEPAAIDHLMRSYFPEGRKDKDGDPYAEASDLYLQTPNGRTVERLTNAAGYDGDGDFDSHSGHRIVYISNRDGNSSLSIVDLHGHTLKKLNEGKGLKRSPRFSPDGNFLVWAQKAADAPVEAPFKIIITDKDFKNPHLMIASGEAETQMDPFWLPKGDGIIFSSNRGSHYFNLYVSDREGKCIRRINKADFDEVQPSVSADGKHIVFTSHKDGLSHIYMMDFPTSGECLPQPSPTATPVPITVPIVTPTAKVAPTATPPPSVTPVPKAKIKTAPTPVQAAKPVVPIPAAAPAANLSSSANTLTAPNATATPASSPSPNLTPKFRRRPRGGQIRPAPEASPTTSSGSSAATPAEPTATPNSKPDNGPGL